MDAAAVRNAARSASVVWIASPNNPTGLPEPEGAIGELLAGLATDAADRRSVPPIVVLDEAYAEFAGRSLVDLRAAYERLVVVRTASKAYGLAGLRVGFAIARRSTLALMEPYRPPGSVAVPSVAVVADMLPDRESLAVAVGAIERERDRLATALAAIGWPAWPSITNFLLVPLGSPEHAADVAEALLRLGMVPRTFPAGHPLADHLRITVRTPADDDRLVAAIAGVPVRGAS
jgi:histidinol-phosphate aminotransferase